MAQLKSAYDNSIVSIDHLQNKLAELFTTNSELRQSAVTSRRAVEKLENDKLTLEVGSKCFFGKADDNSSEKLLQLLEIKD